MGSSFFEWQQKLIHERREDVLLQFVNKKQQNIREITRSGIIPLRNRRN